MLQEIIRVNDEQRKLFLRKVRTALWTLRGKRLAVLGLAYKGGTDDIRESPAIDIIRSLLSEQCSVVAFDPAATERARQVITGDVTYAEDPYQAAVGADALLILTDWEEFASLDLARLKGLLRYPIVIDGRNLYSPEVMQRHGLHYVSVGRATVELESSHASAMNIKE